jgi:hypothetical protein
MARVGRSVPTQGVVLRSNWNAGRPLSQSANDLFLGIAISVVDVCPS